MSTIYILWLRQVKKYLRSRVRIIGSLGQPLLFLVALGFGLGPIYQQAGAGNYLQFIAPGVIAMTILFSAIFGGMEIIWDKQFGFLKETFVAPVSRMQIVFGRVLGGSTVAAMQGLIVLLLTIIFGFRPASWFTLLFVVLVMLIIAVVFSALGTGIASILDDMQGFQLIMNFLVMPIFFFSGALFPLAGLPPALSFLAKIDPLTYGVDALRGILIGVNYYPLYFSITLLLGIMALFLGLSAYLFSKMEL